MRARLIHGDNVEAMDKLLSAGHVAHLAYLDPPFFTQKEHRTKGGELAFSDRWTSLDEYIGVLRERVELVRHLLSRDGCMVLHVDPRTSHYVKVMCDEVFGMESFASEIVWRYRRWPSKTPNFQRVHDVLLRYRRDPEEKPRWNQLYEPLAPSTVATWGKSKQRADVRDGRRVRSTKTAEDSPGVPMGDVWDIGVIAPVAKERTGYPTQKPEKLLDRIIRACSHEGDTVLDPYVGSGTSMVVAERLGRNAIGIDSSDEAIRVARGRLAGEPKG